MCIQTDGGEPPAAMADARAPVRSYGTSMGSPVHMLKTLLPNQAGDLTRLASVFVHRCPLRVNCSTWRATAKVHAVRPICAPVEILAMGCHWIVENVWSRGATGGTKAAVSEDAASGSK
jgi:hypothetical protein